jgi:hypothetical protein
MPITKDTILIINSFFQYFFNSSKNSQSDILSPVTPATKNPMISNIIWGKEAAYSIKITRAGGNIVVLLATIPKITPITEAFQITIKKKMALNPKINAEIKQTKNTTRLFRKILPKVPKVKISWIEVVYKRLY